MRAQLDRTEQRVLGVLIEKELSVPETYPLTLNALVAGCNQKSNRDPILELEEFEVDGALKSLCLKDWAARREGSRAVKFVHQVERKSGIDPAEKAVLAELLLRGPQTPTELRPRVARMGLHLEAAAIADLLTAMANKPEGALVELLARQPRERDARWRHLLGAMAAEHASPASAPTSAAPAAPAEGLAEVLERLAALEARVTALEHSRPEGA
jgi:uncharacterized protein YceH (UPF0502 family)